MKKHPTRKKRKTKKRATVKVGSYPGQLTFIGEDRADQVKMEFIQFDRDDFIIKEITNPNQALEYFKAEKVNWLNVDGIHDAQLMEKLGDLLKIDSLVLEDIMNTGHRPKVEEYEDYTFVVLKMLAYNEEEHDISSEQISFVLTNDHVISFQEKPGDVFEPIRDRIRTGLGKVRYSDVDYLAFLLFDIIIDNYFLIIEKFGEQLDGLEERVLVGADEQIMEEIQALKRQLVTVRKAIFPLREMLNFFTKGESNFVSDEYLKYYRDSYDHCLTVMDSLDTYIDTIGSIRDLYMSTISHKMNQIMKVLTIMATLFIPLTFIVGIYGMNFDYMPELKYKYGYFVVWGVMIIITISLVVYFKRKKWF